MTSIPSQGNACLKIRSSMRKQNFYLTLRGNALSYPRRKLKSQLAMKGTWTNNLFSTVATYLEPGIFLLGSEAPLTLPLFKVHRAAMPSCDFNFLFFAVLDKVL